MANKPVSGNGPFEFTDTLGRQVSIPLSAFSFDSTNAIVVNSDWSAITGAPPASALLAFYVKDKLFIPAPSPAAVPAMVVKAADAGPGGNNITIQIVAGAPNPDPSKTTFNIIVKEWDSYSNLSAATIESILGGCDAAGNPKVPGSNPGLVQVLDGSVDTIGAPNLVVGGSMSGSPARADVNGTGSPARIFTLMAKKPGADGARTTFSVTPNLSSPHIGLETFSLVATWQKEVDGVTIATLQALVQSALGYEITVTTPSSGAYSVPAASTTALSGGAIGVAASATLFTGV